MPSHHLPFQIIVAVSLVLFGLSLFNRLKLISRGAAEDRGGRVVERIIAVVGGVLGQRKVLNRPYGINHLVIFWAFLVLMVANLDFLIAGIIPGAGLFLLTPAVHNPLLLLFDLVSLAVLIALVIAAVRRSIAPPFDGARTPEAYAILFMIAILMLSYFSLHGAKLLLGEEAASGWMPVSREIGTILASLVPGREQTIATVSWWLHAATLLLFMNYLPLSKHMHILTAIPNCYLQSLDMPVLPPREVYATGGSLGVAMVTDFTWKDLMDSLTCAECGRCEQVCPAAVTGKSLSPRRLIRVIKSNLMQHADRIAAGMAPVAGVVGNGEAQIGVKTIWDCTTCGACMAICPVFIEQMPKLVKLRRHLVQMKADFPEELLNLFENMEGRSNPWGIAPSERTKWAASLDAKPFEEGKTEYLFYVGCAGSFDSRQKQVSVALARILNAAGVTWGILGKDEPCCGDSLRRLGNEFIFDTMARDNVQLFLERGVKKIVTSCPHCFTTLKNDYRQYGAELMVLHHSELIDQLIAQGSIKLTAASEGEGKKIALHDSCYLGRHNGIYKEPRNVVKAVCGAQPVELGRSREESFCCGAGGGRMWLEEHDGSRINLNRIDEALTTGAETLCVACPYCMTMFEDGLKDKQVENRRVVDLAELVAARL